MILHTLYMSNCRSWLGLSGALISCQDSVHQLVSPSPGSQIVPWGGSEGKGGWYVNS